MKVFLQALAIASATLFSPPTPLAQSLGPSVVNPVVVPAVSSQGEPLTLVLTSYGCGEYNAPFITVSNFVVTVTQAVNPECGFATPAGEIEFPLGTFSPGSYTLVYQPTDRLNMGNIWQAQTTQFTVLEPVSVPGGGGFAALLLVLTMLIPGIAVLYLNRARS